MQHVPPLIGVTHTFPRTNLSHPICGLSNFYSGIWKFMETGDLCCKPRTFPSARRLSANDSYFSVNFSHLVFLKLFWLFLLFLQLGHLLPLGMIPLVFTLHGQGIVFHSLHKIPTRVMGPSSHATCTGSLSQPVKPLTRYCKSCVSLGQIYVYL